MSQRTVHQLVHTLSYGDAISGEVLSLQRCLRQLGYESEIFAINEHPLLRGRSMDYRFFPAERCDQVILHYSLGSPLNPLYLSLEKSRRTIIYHNLTPARWFEGVNPRVAQDIEAGLSELPKLLTISDDILADSRFNAGELKELGFEARVLELPVDPARWDVSPNTGIARLLQSDPGIHVVHVGRLAPNKRVEDIIKCFYVLQRYLEPKSKLWLAGIDIDTELYSFSLKRLVAQLGLEEHVKFAGCMADSELRALYENATAYLCMSEHEGFCLPLLEAMHFGLPVVAFASSAVPDTVGSGGILVTEKRYAEVAQVIYEIGTRPELRAQLVAAGKERLMQLSFEKFFQEVSEIFSVREDAANPAAPEWRRTAEWQPA